MKVGAVGASPVPPTPAAKKKSDLEKVGREFEAIFVRSMLKNSPIAGKGDVYGDMAVDAMATSVTAGKGLGLADLIRKAVEKNEEALKKAG